MQVCVMSRLDGTHAKLYFPTTQELISFIVAVALNNGNLLLPVGRYVSYQVRWLNDSCLWNIWMILIDLLVTALLEQYF